MTTRLLLLFALIGACVCLDPYSKAALGDEITNLPGLSGKAGFRMFGGYIPVHGGDRQIYYWFVESQRNPSTDALLWWTNGGPGCSGLSGFADELGPFQPTANGSLAANPYSWNKIANVIFVEQPVGVGFSYPLIQNYTDDNAANDNYDFVVGWFKKFPNYNQHKFYLSGESYGGHYLPTLAVKLVERTGVPNFSGFLVGNPLTFLLDTDYGQAATMYYHSIVPKPMWDYYQGLGCPAIDNKTPACQAIVAQMQALMSSLDPYGLDFPICATSQAAGRHERFLLRSAIHLNAVARNTTSPIRGYYPDNYQPCQDNYSTAYFNRADVQDAIHAKRTSGWASCNNPIFTQWNASDVAAAMMPNYKKVIASGKGLRILVYSGDDDTVCSTVDSQQWIWDLGYKVVRPWQPWMLDQQVAGFAVHFEGFNFTTIHGAGHMVPATRPAQALAMLNNFLTGGSW